MYPTELLQMIKRIEIYNNEKSLWGEELLQMIKETATAT